MTRKELTAEVRRLKSEPGRVGASIDGSLLSPRDLPALWRSSAENLRPYAETAAHAFERAAEDLEHALHSEADERLTLAQAAEVSGYSQDYLGRMLRSNQVPNAGRPHAPRIRRSDLPRKACRLPSKGSVPHLVGATPGEIARAVVTSQQGD